jgi:malonyl-CoA O-methyltransferase
VCGDLEQLPFKEASFDLLWSSLALQWCQPKLAYAELQRVLKPEGKLVFSTLTTGSLRELETAFDGIATHRQVLPFASIDEVTASLHAAGFTNLQIRSERFVTQHADFRSLLASIRGIGANQSGGPQRRGLMGKNAWQTAQARYQALRDADGLLPLSYELLFVCAEK